MNWSKTFLYWSFCSVYFILLWWFSNKIHMSDFRDFKIDENDNSSPERIMWHCLHYMHIFVCWIIISYYCSFHDWVVLYNLILVGGRFLLWSLILFWGQTNCVCMFSSNRHKTILRRDGATFRGGISARAVSYSIALWSGVAAFTIWDWPWDKHSFTFVVL